MIPLYISRKDKVESSEMLHTQHNELIHWKRYQGPIKSLKAATKIMATLSNQFIKREKNYLFV